jgi:hypothetical protein
LRTQNRTSTSIFQELIHIASPEEETNPAAAPDRYWRHPAGEVKRTRDLWPWAGWRCFIVNTAEAGFKVSVTVECSVSLQNSAWQVALMCDVALSCPQRNIPRLMDLVLLGAGRDPDQALRHFLVEEIQQIASTTALIDDAGEPNAGAIGSQLNSRLEETYGLICKLKFGVEGRNAISRVTRTASFRTRLADYPDELLLTATFELGDRCDDELLAIASASHLPELDTMVGEAIGRFCVKQVCLDDLYDPSRLAVVLPKAAASFADACSSFGRTGSLISLECPKLPEIPCRNPEILQGAVPSILLSQQIDLMTISYSVVFQVTDRSRILQGTRLRPGLRFTDIAEEEIIAVITKKSELWTVEELLNNRQNLEKELGQDIQSWAARYGVAATRFRLRTPLDKPIIDPDQTITLCNEFFQTSLAGIALHISAVADFTVSAFYRNRSPYELGEQLKAAATAAVGKVAANKTPEVIVKFWNSPDPRTALPVSYELREALNQVLRVVTEEAAIQVELQNREQFASALEHIMASPLEFADIRLARGGMALPARLLLTGIVTAVTSSGWTDLMATVTEGRLWDPTKALFLAMPQLCKAAFEISQPSSLAARSDEVRTRLAVVRQSIENQFGLVIDFTAEVVATTQEIVLLDEMVETGTPEVPVRFSVMTRMDLDPFGEAPIPEELARLFTLRIVPGLRKELRARAIAEITMHWESPEPGKRPLKDQFIQKIRQWVEAFGRPIELEVGIKGIREAARAVNALKQTNINIEKVALTRDGVPISVTANLSARPTGLNDNGWRALYAAVGRGASWDVESAVRAEVRSAIQSAFESLTSRYAGANPSKERVISDLCEAVGQGIAETVGVLAKFTLQLDSPPVVVSYFKRAEDQRGEAVVRHYEQIEYISKLIRGKEEEKLKLLANGQPRTSPDVKDVETSIFELEKELARIQEKGVALEHTFADAQWLLLVLSGPGGSGALPAGEDRRKELK